MLRPPLAPPPRLASWLLAAICIRASRQPNMAVAYLGPPLAKSAAHCQRHLAMPIWRHAAGQVWPCLSRPSCRPNMAPLIWSRRRPNLQPAVRHILSGGRLLAKSGHAYLSRAALAAKSGSAYLGPSLAKSAAHCQAHLASLIWRPAASQIWPCLSRPSCWPNMVLLIWARRRPNLQPTVRHIWQCLSGGLLPAKSGHAYLGRAAVQIWLCLSRPTAGQICNPPSGTFGCANLAACCRPNLAMLI